MERWCRLKHGGEVSFDACEDGDAHEEWWVGRRPTQQDGSGVTRPYP